MNLESLARGRAYAESASDLRLKHLKGSLLILGRVAVDEPFIARCIEVKGESSARDLGLVMVRFSRALDALSMSLSGWVVARVGPGSRLLSARPADVDLAVRILRTFGLDPSNSTRHG